MSNAEPSDCSPMRGSIPLEGQWRDMAQVLLRPARFGNETGALPNGEFEAGKEVGIYIHMHAMTPS